MRLLGTLDPGEEATDRIDVAVAVVVAEEPGHNSGPRPAVATIQGAPCEPPFDDYGGDIPQSLAIVAADHFRKKG